ncbi:MAG: arylsulfatase [Gemmataceae bacterium]|nr:arylsulfatase [Gemmataceae bacterium]MDW8266107.1 arylsulfatase [Gemmataceae bacterium]
MNHGCLWRGALCALVALASVPASRAGAPDSARRPNIVLILVDDLGYADLGCYGGEIHTPNLDRLAAQGMRWRNFYNAAQCCPTRASLLTGLYPHQAGIGDMIDPHSDLIRQHANSPQYSDHLSRSAVTIAELLRDAGYCTYMVGKWHLGYRAGERPRDRGFDRYFGIIGGADSYWKPRSLYLDDEPVKEVPQGFHATDAFTTKAIEFISEKKEQPFFLYLAYNAPHAPFHAHEADIAKYKATYQVGWDVIRERRFARQKELGFWPKDLALPERDPTSQPWTGSPEQLKLAERMAIYAAMVDRIDQNIGRLLEALSKQGIREDTLILFLSDNGAWASSATYGIEWAETGNTPFRLFKLFVHEGGICTPFIACWPRRIPAGVLDTRRYGHVKDIMATCLELAGATYPETYQGRRLIPLEGYSLVPFLLDPNKEYRPTLFWERMGNSAVREGRWKLVRYYNDSRVKEVSFGPRTGKWELFDLATDPNERSNLVEKHPDIAARLRAQYEAWEQRVGVVPRERIMERIAEAAKKEQAQP